MANTPQEVFASMQSINKQLLAHEAGAKKAFEGAKKGLRSAIDDESEDEINLALPALADAVTELDKNVDACDRLHVLTTELMKHPEFIASHKADVKNIVTRLRPQEEGAARLAEGGSRPAGRGEEGHGAVAEAGDRATEADLGGLKNRASKLAKDIAGLQGAVPASSTRRPATPPTRTTTRPPRRRACRSGT